MCQTALLGVFFFFLQSAETPLLAQINYLAISALWLVLKFLNLTALSSLLQIASIFWNRSTSRRQILVATIRVIGVKL